MKLSKLISISLTTSAVTVYLFGVMVVGAFAQTSAVVVGSDEVFLTEDDLELEQMGVRSGFGLVVSRWVTDLRERFSDDPLEVAENAEKELSLLVAEVESGVDQDSEKISKAKQRYEDKLAKLGGLLEDVDNTQREVLLERIAKHEAVLNNLFLFDANEVSAVAVEKVLGNLEDWKDRALNRFEEKEDKVRARLETRVEVIQDKLEKKQESLEDKLDTRREKIRERQDRLEELRARWIEKQGDVNAKRLEAAEVKKLRLEDKSDVAVDKTEAAEEKFRVRYEEKQKVFEERKKVRELESSSTDYQVVKGIIDYQPAGFLERLGWWLGGN